MHGSAAAAACTSSPRAATATTTRTTHQDRDHGTRTTAQGHRRRPGRYRPGRQARNLRRAGREPHLPPGRRSARRCRRSCTQGCCRRGDLNSCRRHDGWCRRVPSIPCAVSDSGGSRCLRVPALTGLCRAAFTSSDDKVMTSDTSTVRPGRVSAASCSSARSAAVRELDRSCLRQGRRARGCSRRCRTSRCGTPSRPSPQSRSCPVATVHRTLGAPLRPPRRGLTSRRRGS
jgi:hypothetical protein